MSLHISCGIFVFPDMIVTRLVLIYCTAFYQWSSRRRDSPCACRNMLQSFNDRAGAIIYSTKRHPCHLDPCVATAPCFSVLQAVITRASSIKCGLSDLEWRCACLLQPFLSLHGLHTFTARSCRVQIHPCYFHPCGMGILLVPYFQVGYYDYTFCTSYCTLVDLLGYTCAWQCEHIVVQLTY